jgi:hypothetical protein
MGGRGAIVFHDYRNLDGNRFPDRRSVEKNETCLDQHPRRATDRRLVAIRARR